jgi:hypothetical protein
MSVTGLNCGKCGSSLKNDTINKNGNDVKVAKCPNGCGMIKSPVCCGQDMECKM